MTRSSRSSRAALIVAGLLALGACDDGPPADQARPSQTGDETEQLEVDVAPTEDAS